MFRLFFSRRMKYVGVLCIVWGTVSFVLKSQRFAIYDVNLLCGMLSWGFCFLFFSKEKHDDERIHMLKFRALTYGVPFALLVTHLINYFYFNIGTSHTDTTGSISALQAIAGMLGVSLVLFYGLKFNSERR